FSARHSSVYTIRRSPRSPLFPYATLFRSLVSRLRFQPFLRHAHPALPAAVVLAAVGQPPLRAAHGPAPAARVLPAVLGRRSPLPDRKSTRLNSSHVKISYAVFCLKKKNYI